MADLSVAEAASALGVDESRVRQMLRSGALAGRHVGRAWVVSGDDIAVLGHQRPRSGRPLSPPRAWGIVDLLDGGNASWLDRYARSKVRAHFRGLAGANPAAWRDALRGRERRHPIRAHRAALGRLRDRDGVWPAGPATASMAGADSIALEAVPEFYIPEETWPGLAKELRLGPASSRPDAIVRIPRDMWPFGPNGPGRAALAVSLLDSGEWRASRAGADVLNDLATRYLG